MAKLSPFTCKRERPLADSWQVAQRGHSPRRKELRTLPRKWSSLNILMERLWMPSQCNQQISINWLHLKSISLILKGSASGSRGDFEGFSFTASVCEESQVFSVHGGEGFLSFNDIWMKSRNKRVQTRGWYTKVRCCTRFFYSWCHGGTNYCTSEWGNNYWQLISLSYITSEKGVHLDLMELNNEGMLLFLKQSAVLTYFKSLNEEEQRVWIDSSCSSCQRWNRLLLSLW